jgi:RHS repeat-associated protein
VIDPANRRVGKTVNGVLTQGFLYEDQLRIAAELDGAGNVVSRFVYGTRVNGPEYIVKGGVTYRLVTDHLGSPRLVIDVNTGTVAQRMEYDEFGRVLTDTNPGFQPFGFAGGLYDRDTGLVRFGARDYDAMTGRWTTIDPLLFRGRAANLYSHVGNDPVNRIDPKGLSNCSSPPSPRGRSGTMRSAGSRRSPTPSRARSGSATTSPIG